MPGPNESLVRNPADGSTLPIASFSCEHITLVMADCSSPSDLEEVPMLVTLIRVHHTVPRLHSRDCPLRDPEHWLAELYLNDEDPLPLAESHVST